MTERSTGALATRRRGPLVRALVAATILLGGTGVAEASDTDVSRYLVGDPAATIRSILHGKPVRSRLSAAGVGVADVQHDVDAMTPEERARLMHALIRPWPRSNTYAVADYRAQYLLMVSLMRESTLFASVLSTKYNGFK